MSRDDSCAASDPSLEDILAVKAKCERCDGYRSMLVYKAGGVPLAYCPVCDAQSIASANSLGLTIDRAAR